MLFKIREICLSISFVSSWINQGPQMPQTSLSQKFMPTFWQIPRLASKALVH